MSLRKTLKRWLYGKCPGFAGAFPYYGARVHFPRNAFIFDEVCHQGIYEQHLLDLILTVVEPGSLYIDAGCNIGLMSLPVLSTRKDVRVLSFEPSPNSYPYLRKTWEGSKWKDRWKIISKAVSDRAGEAEWALSEEAYGGYDGMRSTGRVKTVGAHKVAVTTFDEEWREMGKPSVSCIKMDIEGAELQAIQGGRSLIQAMRPYIFLEWYRENFQCFGGRAEDILDIAKEFDYEVVAATNLNVIQSPAVLALQMRRTSAFILVPRATEAITMSRSRSLRGEGV